MEYKYKASFSSVVKCIISEDKDRFLAKASLDNLKSIIPLEYQNHQALLPVAGNLCVVNVGNKNYHLIDTETALNAYKKFIGCGLNWEHSRMDYCGHITNVALTKYNPNYTVEIDSEVIEEKDVAGSYDPFNIAIGGVIYKTTPIAEVVEESNDPENPRFMNVSLSWEIGFSDYYLAVGSKNLSEAEIVKDKKQIKNLEQYSFWFGGNGKTPDGKVIYQVPCGEIIPLGAGLTMMPAAAVKGLVIASETQDEQPEVSETVKEIEVETEKECEKCNCTQVFEESKEKSSQMESLVVKENMRKNISKIEELSLINDENQHEFCVASIREVLKDAMVSADAEYQKKIQEKEVELKATQENLKKTSEDLAIVKAELETLTKQLVEIQEKQAQVEAEAKFNQRMSLLDSDYDLVDEDRAVIAKQIKDISDDAFEAWLKDFEVLAALKKKKAKKEDKLKEDMSSESKIDDVLDKAEEEKIAIANVMSNDSTNMTEKYKSAFSKENLKFNLKK